jgi:hypothetical protein
MKHKGAARSSQLAGWWLLGLCAALGAPAQAADPLKTEDKQGALSAYMQAQEAFDRGDLPAAERALERAYVISPGDPDVRRLRDALLQTRARERAMERTLEAVVRPAAERESIEVLGQPDTVPPGEIVNLPGVPAVGLGRLYQPPEEGRFEVLTAPTRAGFQKFYREGIGLQLIPGLGFSGRLEMFEEPNPVDDYVLEAKILNFSEISQFRRHLTPLYTRAYATRLIADYEPWPRLQYEFDKRHIWHEFETRYNYKDRNLETHSISGLYSFPRIPGLGVLTLNPYYKRVFQESDQDIGAFEDKDELELLTSLRPSDTLEYFVKYNTAEIVKIRSLGGSKVQLFQGQIRWRFPQWKLFAIPSYEHSWTTFDPSDDEFIKKDFFVDWGFDITPRLRASLKERMVLSEVTQAGQTPSNPTAEVYEFEHTVSYELFKDFDVSLGVDYARAAGLNSYNNVGFRAEMELFKPGLIRASLGYEYLSYYNIDDDLQLFFFRLFLFQ